MVQNHKRKEKGMVLIVTENLIQLLLIQKKIFLLNIVIIICESKNKLYFHNRILAAQIMVLCVSNVTDGPFLPTTHQI